jgi:hypothetical protein
MRERRTKYNRKQSKFARPKNAYMTFNDNVLDHKFDAKYEKLRVQQTKLQLMVDRIYDYDDYHRFSLDNDPELWWLEMTKKQPPRLMPRTRGWYERNPQAHIVRDDWDDGATDVQVNQAVAVATAARDLDEVGYLS